MTTTKIDQKEYLKRYLSNDKDKKKKKKKKDKHSGKAASNIKIIDADDFVQTYQHVEDIETDAFGLGDEAPQIVGIIDDRPAELKAKEDFDSNKWKKLANDETEVSLAGKYPGSKKDNNHKYKTIHSQKKTESIETAHSTKSRTNRRSASSSDQSPPRKTTKSTGTTEKYLERKSRRQSDSDASPPRREKKRFSRSPSRREHKTHHSSSRNERSRDLDVQPSRKDMRKSKRDSDSDQSPVRRKPEKRAKESPRRRNDSDESPPRRQQQSRKRSSDESPPRRNRPTDLGNRKIKQEPLDSDEDPPRRTTKSNSRFTDCGNSPPRNIKREQRSPSARIKQEPADPEPGPSSGRMKTTLDGKRAGLQDAKTMKHENERFRQRENEIFDKMSDDTSGRYAKTVVREKPGRRKEIEEELRKEFEKRKRDDKKKEIYTRWGKGVKQTEDYKAQLEEAAHEMSKPLARYADDEDLDDYLKKQERIGDPMLDYIRSKKKDKDRQEGRPVKPTYKGSFPDNRFGIRPGYRWDGVDRSNGFEKKWFAMTSTKKAVEEEAYKYSVEDM